MNNLTASLVLSISVIASTALLAHDSGAVVDSSGKYITTGSGDCVVFGSPGPDSCRATQTGIQKNNPRSVASKKNAEPEVAEIIDLTGIRFKTNSDILDSSSNQRLDAEATDLKNNPGTNIIVAGHTDSSGDAAYNQSLSKKRADAVRKYLIEKGVDGSRLTARGYGESEPVANNDTSEGRAKNRRVELRILK